ncbi:hypothetical protein, partial [Parasutterella sp.]|uniref:hypothetical protein n=1 Tax=Parasutterella sp. TaxID=2049037 RepID=UPI003AB7DB2D
MKTVKTFNNPAFGSTIVWSQNPTSTVNLVGLRFSSPTFVNHFFLSWAQDGNGNTVAYTYDDQNRVTKVSQGDNSTSISYTMGTDGVNTTSITDAMGHEKIEVTNAAGLTETTTSKGNLGESISTKFTYDTNGNKTKETYENGAYKTYHYDK